MLFAQPPDISRISLGGGGAAALPPRLLAAAAAPGGGMRARMGRGGRLVLDRVHPLSYEPLNGAAGSPDDDEARFFPPLFLLVAIARVLAGGCWAEGHPCDVCVLLVCDSQHWHGRRCRAQASRAEEVVDNQSQGL